MFQLEKLGERIRNSNSVNAYIFDYNGKKYIFKRAKNGVNKYNELIGEKIANRMNIPCAHYFLGNYKGEDVIISEMFDTRHYYSMNKFLKSHVHDYDESDDNNLMNIWNSFESVFDEEITKKLMDQLVKIFIFDIMIDNRDRHDENYGLIINGGDVNFAPLFDNDMMFDSLSAKQDEISLGLEDGDVDGHLFSQDYNEGDLLTKFLKISDNKYLDELEGYLPIIEEKSIMEILQELRNDGVDISSDEEETILDSFKYNLEKIRDIINTHKGMNRNAL